MECTACDAARTMSGVEVMQFHGNATLERLRPRLKCRRCKRKAAKLTVLPLSIPVRGGALDFGDSLPNAPNPVAPRHNGTGWMKLITAE